MPELVVSAPKHLQQPKKRLHYAGRVLRIPFVLLSLKAQLPLLMNRAKEGVEALHDLLQYCKDQAGAVDAVEHNNPGEQGEASRHML